MRERKEGTKWHNSKTPGQNEEDTLQEKKSPKKNKYSNGVRPHIKQMGTGYDLSKTGRFSSVDS